MDKGVRAAQNVNLLRWARYYGIDVGWNILWGFPGETGGGLRGAGGRRPAPGAPAAAGQRGPAVAGAVQPAVHPARAVPARSPHTRAQLPVTSIRPLWTSNGSRTSSTTNWRTPCPTRHTRTAARRGCGGGRAAWEAARRRSLMYRSAPGLPADLRRPHPGQPRHVHIPRHARRHLPRLRATARRTAAAVHHDSVSPSRSARSRTLSSSSRTAA